MEKTKIKNIIEQTVKYFWKAVKPALVLATIELLNSKVAKK